MNPMFWELLYQTPQAVILLTVFDTYLKSCKLWPKHVGQVAILRYVNEPR